MAQRGKMEVLCINKKLSHDELEKILHKLENDKDKVASGLVCKQWLCFQSTQTRKLRFPGNECLSLPSLIKMAVRFPCILELDFSKIREPFFVKDEHLAVIFARFNRVEILNLSGCSGITDAWIGAVKSELPNLQSLNMSMCYKLSGKALAAFVEGRSSLKSLDVSMCFNITDELLEALSKNCPNLETLEFRYTDITDTGLVVLADGCPKINFLDAHYCEYIGDVGVSAIAKACSWLRILKLSSCKRVSDASIYVLAQSCRNLEVLLVRNCSRISGASIISLVMACKQLRILNLHSCLITDPSLGCIFSQCKNLVALDIGDTYVSNIAFEELGRGDFDSALEILSVTFCRKLTVTAIDRLLDKCKSLEYLDVLQCPNITWYLCDQAGIVFPDRCQVFFTDNDVGPEPDEFY